METPPLSTKRIPNDKLLRYVFAASVIALILSFVGGILALWVDYAQFIGMVAIWLIFGTAAGAFLGLLFGVPKRAKIDSSATHGASGISTEEAAARKTFGYGGNTNFEEISDWLTKVIVGATLVGLRDALSAIWTVAKSMNALGPDYASAGASLVVGTGGTGAVAGFISMYLWTRSYLPRMFNDAERDDSESAVSEPRLDSGLGSLALARTPGGRKATSRGETGFRPTGEAPWIGKLEGLTRVQVWNTDFNHGMFGGQSQSDSRILSATLGKRSPNSVEVTLSVVSTNPITKPLEGPVTFYLHPTFTRPVITVEAAKSNAQVVIVTADAFTIGVECDDGHTVLELDLATLAGFPLDLGGLVPATNPEAGVEPIDSGRDSDHGSTGDIEGTPPKERSDD